MNEPKGKLRDETENADPTPHETGTSGGEVDELAGGTDNTTDDTDAAARGEQAAGGPASPS